MVRVRLVQRFMDKEPDLEARIIKAIGIAGPRNIAQISRMTGAHQETIRYKVKKRFGRLGFKFHAEVDYSKIGLSLHWGTLNFSKTHYSLAPQMLTALNEVGYLTYFTKLLPQGNHAALFALPTDTTDRYREFLVRLVDSEILESFTLDQVAVSRHRLMDPRFFNFRSGRWEVEWSKLRDQKPSPLQMGRRASAEDFDHYDLLVIKELQKNSLQHLTGIARKVRVRQKTLEYHYRTHVQKWKLVPSYRIRWAQDITKKLVHSTILVRLTFHDLRQSEFTKAQAAVSKIPFLWAEDLLRNGTYIATMYVPPTDIVHVLAYISDAVQNLASRVDIAFIKHAEAASFTIPYNMYQNGEWKFDTHQMETALRKRFNMAGHE